jgi:acyl-CoA synthetase (AMP-forming)/AMP-acid ligase II
MPPLPLAPQPLAAAFTNLYRADPDRCLFVFTDVQGGDVARRTVGELASRADGIRKLLSEEGIKPGDRVLLLHLPSLEFVEAFLGCLAAGVLPLPVAPPNPFVLDEDLARVFAVAEQCGARAILTHQACLAMVPAESRRATETPLRHWVASDLGEHVPVPDLDAWYRPPGLDEVAYLQLTSGTTGPPKCVAVSHRNMHVEVAALAENLGLGPDTIAVTWVPHYHDLGLVGFLFSTLAGNAGRTYLISPLDFLQRPAVWFDVISRVRGTHTSGPNFAFDLMRRKTTEEQRAGWDLSSVRVFSAGGELVRSEYVEPFFDMFSGTGLDRASFHPGYGLAEHTMSLSMGTGGPIMLDRDQLAHGHVVPVGGDADRPRRAPAVCYGAGWAIKPGTSLRIVDPETGRPCASDEIGEIWVHSPTKAPGYWGREQETQETFEAAVGDGDTGRYLRTGDLGFLLAGELYVTGRLKDVVAIGDRRFHAEDIEHAIRGVHPDIRRGGIAAFSAPRCPVVDGQQLVVLVETVRDVTNEYHAERIRQAVRVRVFDGFGIVGVEVVLGRNLVEKTTSGKVRRGASRAKFLELEDVKIVKDVKVEEPRW